MSNLTDALIAAKLVGGSGGSGGGSGLPEITTETVTTLDDDVVIAEGSGGTAVTQALAGGESVTVSWGGTSYSCKATEVSEGSVTAVVFGNLSIVKMGEDTGEPFVFIQTEQDGEVGYEIISSASDGTYHVTVSATVQSPVDGSILIAKNGVWGTQSGYAYEKNGDLIPIDSTLLAEVHFSYEGDALRCDKSIDYIGASAPLRASVGSSTLGSVDYDPNDGKLVLSVIAGDMIVLFGYDDQSQLWFRKASKALAGGGEPVVVPATVGTFTSGSASITLNSADIDKLASAIDSGGVGYINCGARVPYLRVDKSNAILHALGYNFEGTGTGARYIKFYMISQLSTNTTIYSGKITIAQ